MTRAHQSGMAHFDALMWPIYGGRKGKELCTFVAVDERKNSETDSKSGITEIMGKKSKEGVAMSFTASIFHESCKCI